MAGGVSVVEPSSIITMKLRTWNARDIARGTRVLLRIDANIPTGVSLRGSSDRIAKIIPEIKRLRSRGARIIIMTHWGRPRGHDRALSVSPIATMIGSVLGTKIICSRDVVGESARSMAEDLEPGEIGMIENLRFDPREEKNSLAFARAFAKLGDVYINNAFSVCHRAHASVSAITKCLPSFAGQLLVDEVEALSRPITHPAVLIVGGNKLETKIPLLTALGKKVDHVLLGSGPARELTKLRPSKEAKKIIESLGKKLHLPEDVRYDADRVVIDVGPKTSKAFASIIRTAKTIIWNGPVGIVESPAGARGSKALLTAIPKTRDAYSIIGGGDTVEFVRQAKALKRFSFVSTGGGAMLAFLAGEKMPGLEALHMGKSH